VPIVLPDSMFNEEESEDGTSLTDGTAKSGSSKTSGDKSASSTSQSGGFKDLLNKATSLFGGSKDSGSSDSNKSKDAKSSAAGKDPLKKDGTSKDPSRQDPASLLSGDPSQLLSGDQSGAAPLDGMAAMAMQIVYPVLKVPFESQIRRITVKVTWSEGSAERDFELTQYFVAEQPAQTGTDPNNPNASQTGTSTSTGTTTSTSSTGTSSGTTK